jgi:ADP-heptose:LPS heptosyltransferase
MLRRARPDARIVLAAPLVFEPIARATGLVDGMVAAHELEPLRRPPHRPELAIDLHGNGPESRALLEASDPDQLLAYYGGPVQWRFEEHEALRWCRLLGEGLGLRADSAPSVSGMLPSLGRAPRLAGATVLHCGAKAASRRWPADRFAELAHALRRRGHRVVVTGGAAERTLAEAIAREGEVACATDLDLEDLLALVEHARVVVSGDTGVAHVAAGYRTPSVTLFGPVSPARWGPPPDDRHQVLWHGDGAGNPHGAELDPALAQIAVSEVLPAVDRALAAASDRPVEDRAGV